MAFEDIDTAGVARMLSRIAERPEDAADVFFERSESVCLPADGSVPGLRVRHESGLAVRFEREGDTWLATADEIGGRALADAVRRVARTQPRAMPPEPRIEVPPWPTVRCDEVLGFPSMVRKAMRERQVSAPLEIALERIERQVLVVGTRLVAPVQRERYYSVTVRSPAGRWGSLLTTLDETAAQRVARSLARAWRCRDASPPAPSSGPGVLGPAAAAVAMHEAVAHALEADTLALGGHPEAAVGVRLGPEGLSVLDDPSSAPAAVQRSVDDEGVAALRRWLIRDGVVEQPLCDRAWAATSERLAAGGGRRADRHQPPTPRSYHLEVVPGELAEQTLMADAEGGLYLPEASRGGLDAASGAFFLHFPCALRIQNQTAQEPVGPCTLRGRVADLLSAIVGVGSEVEAAGAGWCAKGGHRLPVWATVPALRIEGLEIAP